MKNMVFLVALAWSGSAAIAGEKPIYADAPAWVKPAPPVDMAHLMSTATPMVLFDNQQMLKDGQAWSYVDTALYVSSAEALGAIGTIQLPWQPDKGDLIVHRIEILRGAERIDVLKGGEKLTVLRREQALEQRMLDGVLTATMAVEGLRVGDVLHAVFSITQKDPTLKGYVQTVSPLLVDPAKLQFGRARLLWPKGSNVRWKGFAQGINAKPVEAGAFEELTIPLPLPKQPEIPNDAPARFQNLPIIEATTFPDWATLAAVMAPLYETAGLIAAGSPLAAEVARIRSAASDPLHRAALALQLVQSQVRYQLMGMSTGNYVPQKPADTWSMRYGDCKAKTLLLLSLLHALDIEAEPVLAHSQLGDLIPSRLPSAAAFDHVLVRATIDAKSYWLDGTGMGDRYEDIGNTPAFANVLPIRATGAALLPIVPRANARPDFLADIEMDQSAGIRLPAAFQGSVTVRGQMAEALKTADAQGSREDKEKMAAGFMANILNNPEVVESKFRFDEAAGTATISARGVAYPQWQRQNDRWSLGLDALAENLKISGDRLRPAWKDIPVRTAGPSNMQVKTRIKLPSGGEGFALDGTAAIADQFGNTRIDRSAVRSGDTIATDMRIVSSGGELAASSLAETRKRAALVTAKPLKALAPSSYANLWNEVEAARKAGRIAPLRALFDAKVAADPKNAWAYLNRARFAVQVFDRQAALADFNRAIELEPTAYSYLERSDVYDNLGQRDKAIADAEEALRTDPSSNDALLTLAFLKSQAGKTREAIAILQEKIDAGGDKDGELVAARAEYEAQGGSTEIALASIDSAISTHPGRASLLNSRCWLKGTMNVALDTALKDCTKSIELSDNPAQALDSRAMVYFRLGRMEEALEDLDAALQQSEEAGSLYLRGVIRKRTGAADAAAADLAAARGIEPGIVERYRKWGVLP